MVFLVFPSHVHRIDLKARGTVPNREKHCDRGTAGGTGLGMRSLSVITGPDICAAVSALANCSVLCNPRGAIGIVFIFFCSWLVPKG